MRIEDYKKWHYDGYGLMENISRVSMKCLIVGDEPLSSFLAWKLLSNGDQCYVIIPNLSNEFIFWESGHHGMYTSPSNMLFHSISEFKAVLNVELDFLVISPSCHDSLKKICLESAELLSSTTTILLDSTYTIHLERAISDYLPDSAVVSMSSDLDIRRLQPAIYSLNQKHIDIQFGLTENSDNSLNVLMGEKILSLVQILQQGDPNCHCSIISPDNPDFCSNIWINIIKVVCLDILNISREDPVSGDPSSFSLMKGVFCEILLLSDANRNRSLPSLDSPESSKLLKKIFNEYNQNLARPKDPFLVPRLYFSHLHHQDSNKDLILAQLLKLQHQANMKLEVSYLHRLHRLVNRNGPFPNVTSNSTTEKEKKNHNHSLSSVESIDSGIRELCAQTQGLIFQDAELIPFDGSLDDGSFPDTSRRPSSGTKGYSSDIIPHQREISDPQAPFSYATPIPFSDGDPSAVYDRNSSIFRYRLPATPNGPSNRIPPRRKKRLPFHHLHSASFDQMPADLHTNAVSLLNTFDPFLLKEQSTTTRYGDVDTTIKILKENPNLKPSGILRRPNHLNHRFPSNLLEAGANEVTHN